MADRAMFGLWSRSVRRWVDSRLGPCVVSFVILLNARAWKEARSADSWQFPSSWPALSLSFIYMYMCLLRERGWWQIVYRILVSSRSSRIVLAQRLGPDLDLTAMDDDNEIVIISRTPLTTTETLIARPHKTPVLSTSHHRRCQRPGRRNQARQTRQPRRHLDL